VGGGRHETAHQADASRGQLRADGHPRADEERGPGTPKTPGWFVNRNSKLALGGSLVQPRIPTNPKYPVPQTMPRAVSRWSTEPPTAYEGASSASASS
jgi:hypothetical protein